MSYRVILKEDPKSDLLIQMLKDLDVVSSIEIEDETDYILKDKVVIDRINNLSEPDFISFASVDDLLDYTKQAIHK